MTTTKTCTKCGTTKPLTEFHKQSSGKHGRRSACATCINTQKKSSYQCKPQPTQTDHVNSVGRFVPAQLPRSATAAGTPAWTPLKPSDLPQPVLRPGAMDHEKYGSLQPDGSVRPYTKTVYGCVGFLKDTTSNARG